MDVRKLKREHRAIIRLASVLGGMASNLKTRDDAYTVRNLIDRIDAMLVAHLAIEDLELYPALAGAKDAWSRALGSDAFADVGSLIGVWIQYRGQWTVEAMLTHQARFAATTTGMLGALAMRVEMEEDSLYPAVLAVIARELEALDAA